MSTDATDSLPTPNVPDAADTERETVDTPADNPADTLETPSALPQDAAPETTDAAAAVPESAPAATPDAEVDAVPVVPVVPVVPGMSLADCAAQLAERFPALFTPGQAKPIKLRVQADIQVRAPAVFSKKLLSAFLHRHTTRTPYLKALAQATERFDLDGAAAGEVAEEHRQAAAAEVERRLALVKERRAADRRPPRREGRERPGPGVPNPVDGARTEAPANAPPAAEGDAPNAGAARHQGRPAGRPAARDGRRRPDDAGRRQDRPPGRPGADRGARPRPPRQESRPQREGATGRGPQAPHSARVDAPREVEADNEPARQRQALLRAWEGTSLTASNFIVLKRLTQTEFDAQIELARNERAERRK